MEFSPPTLTYESNEVVAKNNSNKLWAFIITIVYVVVIIFNFQRNFSGNKFGSITTILVMTVFLIVVWVNVLNKKTKLVINKNGVWLVRKGQFSWTGLWYYHIQITSDGEVKNEKLHFKVKDSDQEISINLNNYDLPKNEILSAFQFYADQFQIHNLGLDDHSKDGFI